MKLRLPSMPGFVGPMLSRSLQVRGRYLLLVEWESQEDHTIGFARYADYADWGRLPHHFYAPVPAVRHFSRVCTLEP
jgi:heme-degrading monooxygenase HmoA